MANKFEVLNGEKAVSNISERLRPLPKAHDLKAAQMYADGVFIPENPDNFLYESGITTATRGSKPGGKGVTAADVEQGNLAFHPSLVGPMTVEKNRIKQLQAQDEAVAARNKQNSRQLSLGAFIFGRHR